MGRIIHRFVIPILLLAGLSAIDAKAEVAFQLLHEFLPPSTAPQFPAMTLVQGTNGNFFGTSTFGGQNNYGTFFTITPAGNLTNLYSFTQLSGLNPYGGVVQGDDGAFYGLASQGSLAGPVGNGTLFRITSAGAFTGLLSFGGTNGTFPTGKLLKASNGWFYGITRDGGSNNLGTVFKFNTNGSFLSLLSFNGTNGAQPVGGLIRCSDGNLYGLTSYGGSNSTGGLSGGGTIFRISSTDSFNTLFTFNSSTGTNPVGRLIEASGSNLYGVTFRGGVSNRGTVFRLSTSGACTVLHSFTGPDGYLPSNGIIEGSDHLLYGSAPSRYIGTTLTNGGLFSLSTNGEISWVTLFDGTNAANGIADFCQGNDGKTYGLITDLQRNKTADQNAGAFFALIPRPILSLTTLPGSGIRLSWNSISNGHYVVQFTPDLSAAWTDLTNLTATSAITVHTNYPVGQSSRCYRVILIP